MQWLTRLVLGLPARAQDIKELREAAPELFADNVDRLRIRRGRLYFPPTYLDSLELREAVQAWIRQSHEREPENREAEPCDLPFCPRKTRNVSSADTPHSVMEMMVVAGGLGKEFNPPAKSFFDLINATKKKRSNVRRVIMTDPYIYADIGQTGSTGGFSNLIKLLRHLNIGEQASFELQLTPRVGEDKKLDLQSRIAREFTGCTLSSHKATSVFHDRFIFVEYEDGDRRAWYGPSLNGLNSDSVVIFGDVTESGGPSQFLRQLRLLKAVDDYVRTGQG